MSDDNLSIWGPRFQVDEGSFSKADKYAYTVYGVYGAHCAWSVWTL